MPNIRSKTRCMYSTCKSLWQVHVLSNGLTGQMASSTIQYFCKTARPNVYVIYNSCLGTISSNYWTRLSRIWRILQVEESVIHRGRKQRWITPSEICRILHILRKLISIIALLFIQNIFFAQTSKLYSQPFPSLLNGTTLRPGFLGQWFNNLWRKWFTKLQQAALLTSFWRQWFDNLQQTALLTSLAQYDRILGQQQLFMVNYVCGFNQLETGKYFEWIIINNYWMRLSMISWVIKTEVCVICQSRRLRQITQTQGFDNSWYHAKTEFNNCFYYTFFKE